MAYDCDVLIIGSGAGGGVVAGELAAAGYDVLVLEKGPYLHGTDFTRREADMLARLYDARASLLTQDGGVALLAGACLGGGTTVNWAGAFRTPDYILEEWAPRARRAPLYQPRLCPQPHCRGRRHRGEHRLRAAQRPERGPARRFGPAGAGHAPSFRAMSGGWTGGQGHLRAWAFRASATRTASSRAP